MRFRKLTYAAIVLTLVGVNVGCSATSAVKCGVRLVGDVVDEEAMKEHKEALIGKPPAAAEEEFGSRIDAWRDVNSDREWLIYPVKMDVLKSSYYMAEVTGKKIVAIEKVKKYADPKIDIPEKLTLEKKVKGKTPKACETELGFGPPLLTARNEQTGCLAQVYDAQKFKVEGVLKPHHCILYFDAQNRCEKVRLVTVEAESDKKWTGF